MLFHEFIAFIGSGSLPKKDRPLDVHFLERHTRRLFTSRTVFIRCAK